MRRPAKRAVMSSFHRVYIQYGESNCLRFLAPGYGGVAWDGARLFEWIRDPRNIPRLRNGLQHVYEIDEEELRHFLEFKLRQDRAYRKQQMSKYARGADMLAAFRRKRAEFASLPTAVDMLEAISNATELVVIPRTRPRKRSDPPGWLYLLNLDRGTLEVYEFKDYMPPRKPRSARLTIKSLYRAFPTQPPGYYVKMRLSVLQSIWRSEWVKLHETHAETLTRLWKRNAKVLKTIPHADTIPFKILYGSYAYGRHGNRMYGSWRLTHGKLRQILGALNRRMPSKISIFESRPSRPRINYIVPRNRVQRRGAASSSRLPQP